MADILPENAIRERIGKRIAREFTERNRKMVINLGVGIPTAVADYIEAGEIFIQAENGMLGVGPVAVGDAVDRRLINAGRQPVTETPGCCYFDSATSFGMIRGGYVDATVIGAFEVDEKGNIANWIIPNGKQLGVGGAMDPRLGSEAGHRGNAAHEQERKTQTGEALQPARNRLCRSRHGRHGTRPVRFRRREVPFERNRTGNFPGHAAIFDRRRIRGV